MTRENSLLVDHRLVRVRPGEYPCASGQVWAEPNVDHAVELLDAIIGDPDRARAMAANARRDVRLAHGFRAVGLRILDRVSQIIAGMTRPVASAARHNSAARRHSTQRARPVSPLQRTQALIRERTLWRARGKSG
jgi:hypothetical protein